MRMRSSNPVLKGVVSTGQGRTGAQYAPGPYAQGPYAQPYQQGAAGYGYQQPGSPTTPTGPAASAEPMTIDDVVMRTGMTLGMVILTAIASFFLFDPANPGLGYALTFGGMIGGLILGLIIAFTRSTNPVLIMLYAAFEGLFVGGISRVFELSLPNTPTGSLVTQAVFGTIFAFATMLALYRFRIVRVTNTFVKVVMGALLGALVLILANFVVGFFIPGGLGLREPSALGVLVSLVMVVLACAVLAIEFNDIESGIKQGIPQRFAWQCAFGLTLTLVWLYIEILRLVWMLQAIFSE
ncbi:Bax inhibitor-1/YccA family protein [Salinactinospora qingdaonensis]|uniref:Bax inhibitor-1/YccA family protein n=1 Tax=Salinactinospora qingdaonensis TaxID=702744 RepID=A0ABP7FKY6_9ACTN